MPDNRSWLVRKMFPVTDKYALYQPKKKITPIYPKEDGTRHCAVCGKSFKSVKEYRDHHFETMCGGYL